MKSRDRISNFRNEEARLSRHPITREHQLKQKKKKRKTELKIILKNGEDLKKK